MKTQIEVKYFSNQSGEKKLSHKCTEQWEKLELFCPNCGKQDVWHETGPGDYYLDEQYLCSACGSSFYLPGGVSKRDGYEQNEQRLSILMNMKYQPGEE